jgi:hypothetical protein
MAVRRFGVILVPFSPWGWWDFGMHSEFNFFILDPSFAPLAARCFTFLPPFSSSECCTTTFLALARPKYVTITTAFLLPPPPSFASLNPSPRLPSSVMEQG